MKTTLLAIVLACISVSAQDQLAGDYPLTLSIKNSSPGSITFTDGGTDYAVSCHKAPSATHFLFPGGGFYAEHVANRKDLCREYPMGTQFRARINADVVNGIASDSSGSRAFSYKLVSRNPLANSAATVTAPDKPPSGKTQNAVASDLGVTVKASKESGVEIVGFSPTSPLQAAGLHVGEVIKAINGRPVKTPEDFHVAMRQADGTALVSYIYLESKMWWVQKDLNVHLTK